MNPSHGDLVLSGVSIRASLNLDILGVQDHMRGIVAGVSQRIDIFRLVTLVFMGTTVLLVAIMTLFFQS